MKRWLSTQIRFSEAELTALETKVKEKVLVFENLPVYKAALKAVVNTEKLLEKDPDNETLKATLETAKNTLAGVNENRPQKQYEDSVEVCLQLGERVVFMDNSYNELDLLDKELIKLGVPMYVDTGTEWKLINEVNYTTVDKTKVVKVKDTKYDVKDKVISEVVTK